MLNALLLTFLFCAPALFAQDLSQDLKFLEAQKTQAQPFSVPLYVDLSGNINVLSKSTDTAMSFRPQMEMAWKKSRSLYIKPIFQKTAFSITRQLEGMEWIEVKRKRWELGLGFGATMNNKVPFSLGLTPFKGSRQVMIRNLKTASEATPDPVIPQELKVMKDWRIGDQGSFQTYGGVALTAGVNYSVVNIVSAGITLQNMFNLMISKLDVSHVQLVISEDSLTNRRLQSGASVVVGSLNQFKGKKLSTLFVLDLNNPSHQELYRKALQGELHELQNLLPRQFQKMEWKGSEKMGYIGVPAVAGKYFSRAEFRTDYEGSENIIDVKSRNSSGFFVPLRNHNKLVYQSEDALTLFWFSEMLKTDDELFTRKFLSPGKAMGAKGFGKVLPEGIKLGSTLAQMGMSFSKKELEDISPELLEEILGHFKNRCEELKLECSNKKKYEKIARTLRGFLPQKWKDIQDKLGFLMLDEPALIHSYIKSIGSKKTVYFKFLNENYQSMEGFAPIEI